MSAPVITWIGADDAPEAFPPAESAFTEPDGLLAAGGDLSPARLLYAYRNGIFPWFDDGQPILWWSPDPRCALLPGELHISRRTRREIKGSDFTMSFNTAFSDVVAACAEDREGQDGTWITTGMKSAYVELHSAGWAHSVEIWVDDKLAGGLYGLAIGKVFFGESMFSRRSNTSKIAMLALCRELVRKDFALLDCQIVSPHLTSLGATLLPRDRFLSILREACASGSPCNDWPDGRITARQLVAG